MLEIKIGLINYTGVACGLAFEKSVAQDVPEDMGLDHPQVKRLLALFPGTVATPIPSDGAGEKVVGSVVGASASTAPVEEPVEEPKDEVVEDEVVEIVASGEDEDLPEDEEGQIAKLVAENSRDELITMAEEIGATFSSRANMVAIATEIVEAMNAG